MQKIRIALKEIASITVADDCAKYFARQYSQYELLRNETCKSIMEAVRNSNPDYVNKAIEVRYEPLTHQFVVYEIVPYLHVMETENNGYSQSLNDANIEIK